MHSLESWINRPKGGQGFVHRMDQHRVHGRCASSIQRNATNLWLSIIEKKDKNRRKIRILSSLSIAWRMFLFSYLNHKYRLKLWKNIAHKFIFNTHQRIIHLKPCNTNTNMTQSQNAYLSHNDFIWTVVFECKRIQAIWSFVLNLSNSLEEVLQNKQTKRKKILNFP